MNTKKEKKNIRSSFYYFSKIPEPFWDLWLNKSGGSRKNIYDELRDIVPGIPVDVWKDDEFVYPDENS